MKHNFLLSVAFLLISTISNAVPKVTGWAPDAAYMTNGNLDLAKGGTPRISYTFTREQVNGVYEDVDMQLVFYIQRNGQNYESAPVYITNSNFLGDTWTGNDRRFIALGTSQAGGVLRAKYRVRSQGSPSYGPYMEISKSLNVINGAINPPGNPPVANSASIYRYYYGASNSANHFYTVSNITPGGYTFEFIEFYALTTQVSGTVPIYRYFDSQNIDHFYTTVSNNSTFPNYAFEKIEFYAYATQQPGTVPVYRYFSPSLKNHFYTTHYSPGGYNGGYYYERIEFYAYQGERR
ncbi:hypothetical protein H8S90_12970 [Olivibacter sp. SDN3]|uniref:hypothetical protein n=1 Tax=Olivibacter sp. SDN3 TaxID=2764720 RepID=UPI0016513FF8|nr:hypothetical protein [Olivibacter sp. SDN3]QNL47736.1 hypothetical protein H8S90_12970 [Olivibacter sp. SDN3]